MDAVQIISSAAQIASSMVAAIGAIEQASRDLDDAPMRIRSLEKFVYELQSLSLRIKQKHAYKLENPQLDQQIQGLNGLIDRLHPNIIKAKRVVTRSKVKNFAKIIWNSMIGDPLEKILLSMRRDLNWWLESQMLAEQIENVIETTASNIPVRLKVGLDQGYPISSKCGYVRDLLEQSSPRRVILIVGLSGIGKSCLARQVASDLPQNFFDGAVELGFGQYCSRASCDGDKHEYQRRLARKLGKFLVQIGFWKKINDESCRDLEYVSFLLQKALYGKRILILLDDVWEQDIVERFAKVYDNDCRYLVTTRNESVYEITEADKVELGKDDIREIGKNVLLYHSHLTEDELPEVAETLLERCGHHPLTVAVMGKALRKEKRAEKWEKAIANLSTYATCAPGPISYVNEKEAENTVTIFGSLEFSLEAMPEDPKRLFTALAVLSWAEPIPETCLEAVWSVLGQEILFSLTVCKLIEGSLLMKDDHDSSYQIHDMVSLYLDSRTSDSINLLLIDSTEESAFISPWLFVFGKEAVKRASEEKIELCLGFLEEKHAAITLEAITHALEVGISSSEFETSRVGFCRILGSKITRLLSSGSEDLVSVSAVAITNVFTKNDYSEYLPFLENTKAVDKLTCILENCEDPLIETSIFSLLANLAEFGSQNTTDEILLRIPMNRLTDLLSPHSDEWHESVFATLMSLIKAGKLKAVEKMFASEIDTSLIKLLKTVSDVAQNNVIMILKTLYELGGPGNTSLRQGTLSSLPWQARLRLEKFVLSDANYSLPSPKRQTFEELVQKLLSFDGKMILEAMQDLIPIIEKVEEPNIRDMILRGPLVKRLSELLQYGQSSMQKEVRSESAFLLMKLACSGGQPCIKKFLEHDIVSELVKMMQCSVAEVQDSAYSALHNILFSNGGGLAVIQIMEGSLLERLIHSMESKSHKTREVSLLCVLDIVEMGNKTCLERMFSSQVVEKIVKIEKLSGGTGEHVVGLLKGISKCKSLTASAERKAMKLQVVKKVRMAIKGHKLESQVLAAVEAYMSEGSKGASTSGNRKKR